MGPGVTLLGLLSPSHHLSERYLAELTISSTCGAFPALAANLFSGHTDATLPDANIPEQTQDLVSPSQPLANSSPLLHIKGGGLGRIRDQNDTWEISVCF